MTVNTKLATRLDTSSSFVIFIQSVIIIHCFLCRMYLDTMSEEQLTRFEYYVRSHLSRTKVENIISSTLSSINKGGQVSSEMSIVVGGLAKLFLGELMETCMSMIF